MDKQTNWTKLSALGLGGLLGLSHISMIVMLATRETSKYPKITTDNDSTETFKM